MNQDLRFEAPPAVLAHRNTSTARRMLRLVPLVVALVLVVFLVFVAVLPVTELWRGSAAGGVLVGP